MKAKETGKKIKPSKEKRKKSVVSRRRSVELNATGMIGVKEIAGKDKLRMIDVAGKAETLRTAEARGEVRMSAAVLQLILENRLPKGDVLAAARLAGIQAAKKTSELIPLCHPLRITSVEVKVRPVKSKRLVEVKSFVKAVDRTGVEMEALTAVAVACLTVYDMCKAFDRKMVIGDIHLLSKAGGKSGDCRWTRK